MKEQLIETIHELLRSAFSKISIAIESGVRLY